MKDPAISYLRKNERKQISALDNINILVYCVPVRQDITFKRTNVEKKIPMQFREKKIVIRPGSYI
jgi:hypothetical protein